MMADEYYDGAYTGEEIDAAVAAAFAAAPQSTTYNKAEVDSALSGKSDASHTHTSSQITDLGAAASKGFDAAPTSGNTNNAVSSDGVATALAGKLSNVARVVFNTEKEMQIPNNNGLLMSVMNYDNVGLFFLFSYTTESVVRIIPIFKTSNFDTYVSVSAVSGDNTKVKVTPSNSNVWCVVNIGDV